VNASRQPSLLDSLCAPTRSRSESRPKKLELLKDDPSHPSLHFKKVGNLWSVSAGINYRALAVEDGADFIWVWIGPHDEHRRLIKQQG
jgi:hypothetical protein